MKQTIIFFAGVFSMVIFLAIMLVRNISNMVEEDENRMKEMEEEYKERERWLLGLKRKKD